MRLGITMPHALAGGGPLGADTTASTARLAERLAFDSVWCFDAIGRGFMLPDPLIALSVAASVTERLTVGTCILQVPLRRPVELAHRILTAHLLCGGRLLLGVGAGSTKADFDAVGVDFATRMQAMDEALVTMRRLWNGQPVGAANLTPWETAKGGPPLLIGSWNGTHWIPRAAKEFDGWIASAAKTSYATLKDGIRRYREAGGRRAIVTNIAADLGEATATMPDDAPFHLRCDPATARTRLERLADLGFDDAIIVPKSHTEAVLAPLRALLA
ncbi:MAG: LLM class flavin-dependent oxidoreductase [Candidatus Rokubacteria bacterium]|nr:LLM class flavin-dependent oxidoreductase [Candidatus Rokubacteria bacterium]